jgi:hypothetical protein
MNHHTPTALCRALLDPEDLGHAVTQEVRQRARRALKAATGIPRIDLYLCGPMTGLPHFNHAAFFDAARRLREAGYTVFNPAENGLPSTATWAQHMRVDIEHLVQCRHIAVLPGYEASKGATLELHIGQVLGMQVLAVPTLLQTSVAEMLQGAPA